MYHKHHTKGIVIGGFNDGDHSRFVKIFTESFGLIGARVQGARKLDSKLRVGVQDFVFGEFSLVRGKNGWKLVGAKVKQNFFELLKDSPTKVAVMTNVLNLIKKVNDEENKNNNIFLITANFLEFLLTAEEREISLVECLTLLRILHSLGYMRQDPELMIPITRSEIEIVDLEMIAPRRAQMVSLINESLKVV